MSRTIPWRKHQCGHDYIFLGPEPREATYRYMVIDDRVEETKEVVVHTFTMGDVDDPDLYAAQPLWEWQESELGKWVMNNATEPLCWYRSVDLTSFGHRYFITAIFRGPRLTEWLLKHDR
jgi:hypothetical protein